MAQRPLLYLYDSDLKEMALNTWRQIPHSNPILVDPSDPNPDAWTTHGADLALLELSAATESHYFRIARALRTHTNIPLLTLLDIRQTDLPLLALGAGTSGILDRSPATLQPQLSALLHLGKSHHHPPELAVEEVPQKFQVKILKQGLFVRKQNSLVKVRFEDLHWIKGMGNYATLYTAKEKLVVTYTLKNLLELLPKPTFARVHRSYIVNLDQIDSINSEGIFIGDQAIPVSKGYRKFLLDTIYVV
ncbi:MAG: LytTR family DNA-binding domain-containing protein [Bacteroidota bacterium]